MIGMAADAVRKTSVVTASASFVPLPPENMVAFGSQACRGVSENLQATRGPHSIRSRFNHGDIAQLS
jgi:hypothetical protein